MISAQAWALYEDRPPGAQFHLEQTAEARASQQAYQGRVAPLGAVPIDTERPEEQRLQSDRHAKSALASISEREAARKNLSPVQQVVNPTARWEGQLIVALGVLVVFAAGYWGMKDLFARRIPDMPFIRRKKKRLNP